jgi:Peptidase C39 family
MRVVLQKSLNDCGLACIAMLADHYGNAVDYDALLSTAPAEMWSQGLSMRTLRQIAAELGLETRAYRCSSQGFQKLEQPSIAHCRGDHYIVVQSCSVRRVEIIDPRFGRISIRREEFAATYSGICLLAEVEEERAQKVFIPKEIKESVWQREMESCFLQWTGALLAVSSLHVAILASVLLVIGHLMSGMGPALLWVEGLVLSRLYEALLLRCYSRCIRKIATLCSPAQGLLVEIPGGYRLSERMRWMAEQLYNSRDNFLELARFLAGLVALLVYCQGVQDLWLGMATFAFGITAVITGSRGISSLPLTEEEHAERRFIESLLQQFVGGAQGPLTRLRARGLLQILNQNLASLIGVTSFAAYWALGPRTHTGTEFLILGIAQLKLLEWWKSALPAAASGRIIHHCYQHLVCMHIAAQATPARAS